MATSQEIERKARELCTAAGKNPDRVVVVTILPPAFREWMNFREVARKALDGWPSHWD